VNSRPNPNDLHFSTLAGSPFPVGKKFVLLPEDSSKVVSLELATTHLVQAIKLICEKDGREHSLQAGSNNPTNYQSIPLTSDLVALSGQSGWYIDALRFHFADGSATPLFGGTGGDIRFHVGMHQKQTVWQGRVVGMWGYADEVGLEALGLIFWSVELNPKQS
jgi:hypothetical protein